MVEKAKKEVDAAIKEAGEEAVVEAGTPGLHPEIIKMLGRLKYRYSYGQNQLKHAVETAHIAAMLAQELGADANVARRGGLLHDLGKAIDQETEGTHSPLHPPPPPPSPPPLRPSPPSPPFLPPPLPLSPGWGGFFSALL